METSLLMNTMSGYVDLKHLDQRQKLYAAQRASQPLNFHPKDGSAPLRAWALNESGHGWWDIIVDNADVEDGTPHRIFETRSRMAGPLDTDVRGLFSVGGPTPRTDRLAHGSSPYQREPNYSDAMAAQAALATRAKREMAERSGPISPMNAPIPPSEQVARTEAGHAAYQAALAGAQMGTATGVGILGLGSIEADEMRRMGAGGVADAVRLQQHHEEQMRRTAIGQPSRGEPGKMFSRSDILAILRGHLALAQQRPPEMNERDAIRALITVFENLE